MLVWIDARRRLSGALAANADLRVPARLQSSTHDLPRRATRNGRPRRIGARQLSAARAACSPTRLLRFPRLLKLTWLRRCGEGAMWRRSSFAGGSCAATRVLSRRREPGTARRPLCAKAPEAERVTYFPSRRLSS